MSDATPTGPAVATLTGLGAARPPRSEAARVVLETFGQRSALIGGAWLGLIAFMAVFAPLVASSHPYLLKLRDGPLSSPWLRHLTSVDVTLLVMALTLAVLALPRRISAATRVGAFTLVLAVTIALSAWLVRPPATVVYDQYRTMQKQGQIEWAVYAPIPYSPSDRLRDQFEAGNPHPHAPSSEHWLGTERNGADILSRMLHACRIAMAVGFISTSIAVALGVFFGGMMGYFSGWADLLGMRLVEVFSAIPRIYLMLAVIAFYGQGAGTLLLIMVIIGITDFPGYALFIRAEFLKLRQQDFVQAARACGLPLRSILFRHILPNGVTPLLVSASFGIASAINVENFLSFLGVGLVEEPSWGQLLGQATTSGGSFRWWLAIFPGLALFLTIFAYILIGESLRDAIDPHSKRSSHA